MSSRLFHEAFEKLREARNGGGVENPDTDTLVGATDSGPFYITCSLNHGPTFRDALRRNFHETPDNFVGLDGLQQFLESSLVSAPEDKHVLPRAPAGVLLDLSPREQHESHDGRSLAAEDWLSSFATSADAISDVLEVFGSLNDPFLAKRLGEVLWRGLQHGVDAQRIHDVDQVVRCLENAGSSSSDAQRVVRCLENAGNNSFLFREDEEPPADSCSTFFDRFLEGVFDRLEGSSDHVFGGRMIIITHNPWELVAIRKFIARHEEPGCRATQAMPEKSKRELYPLLGAGKNYAVRRIESNSKQLKPAQGQGPREGQIYVLEKVARRFTTAVDQHAAELSAKELRQDAGESVIEPPPTPSFEGSSTSTADDAASSPTDEETRTGNFVGLMSKTPSEAHSPSNSRLDAADAPRSPNNVEYLNFAIVARKGVLKSEGLSNSQMRGDPELAALTTQVNAIYRNQPSQMEKINQRSMDRIHVSVQLEEAIKFLSLVNPDGHYVDCTFGRGGHSKRILENLSGEGRVTGFDIDPVAVKVGKELERADNRFRVLHQPFGRLAKMDLDCSWGRRGAPGKSQPLSGVLLDLGVSSPQLDDRTRGFSAYNRKAGPLDLRMNQTVGVPCSEWLTTITAGQLAWVVKQTCYRLPSPLPERIAAAIVQYQRDNGPFQTTRELAKLLEEIALEEFAFSDPDFPGKSPGLAHIVFCALRIFLNQEVPQLKKALAGAFDKLGTGGRLVVICFTRWEMDVVRTFLREHEAPPSSSKSDASSISKKIPHEKLKELYPNIGSEFALRQVVPPQSPTAAELERNPRAKSTMYVLEKYRAEH